MSENKSKKRNPNHKISSKCIFKIIIIFMPIGFGLLGIGIGLFFKEDCLMSTLKGLFAGLGIGFIVSSLICLKVLKRMQLYKEHEL